MCFNELKYTNFRRFNSKYVYEKGDKVVDMNITALYQDTN